MTALVIQSFDEKSIHQFL